MVVLEDILDRETNIVIELHVKGSAMDFTQNHSKMLVI